MSLDDARRWNARYQMDMRESFERPRPFLVEHAHLLPSSGLALDIAMGLGGNAGFYWLRLRVIGVDISLWLCESTSACQRLCQSLPI
jgi:hypothetical protein